MRLSALSLLALLIVSSQVHGEVEHKLIVPCPSSPGIPLTQVTSFLYSYEISPSFWDEWELIHPEDFYYRLDYYCDDSPSCTPNSATALLQLARRKDGMVCAGPDALNQSIRFLLTEIDPVDNPNPCVMFQNNNLIWYAYLPAGIDPCQLDTYNTLPVYVNAFTGTNHCDEDRRFFLCDPETGDTPFHVSLSFVDCCGEDYGNPPSYAWEEMSCSCVYVPPTPTPTPTPTPEPCPPPSNDDPMGMCANPVMECGPTYTVDLECATTTAGFSSSCPSVPDVWFSFHSEDPWPTSTWIVSVTNTGDDPSEVTLKAFEDNGTPIDFDCQTINPGKGKKFFLDVGSFIVDEACTGALPWQFSVGSSPPTVLDIEIECP